VTEDARRASPPGVPSQALREAPLAFAVLGLLVTPALTVVAAIVFPRLSMPEAFAAALHYGAGTTSALVALTIAARATLGDRAAVTMFVAGAALVGVASMAHPAAAFAAVLVNLGLTAAAHAAGGAIGRRVAHPGHLLPACAVAAAADFASVVHPSGPSHAIAGSEKALSLLAIGLTVPGTHAVAPVLGVGDLVFLALVFGAAVAHGLSLIRVAGAAACGIALAGVLAALLEREVPALVPIGAAIVAGVPATRHLRREDRRTATFAIAASIAVVIGILVR
jgi:hypothetical protein